MVKRKNWDEIIDQLNEKGEVSVKMTTPGSAQATRARLMKVYRGIESWTTGNRINLKLK